MRVITSAPKGACAFSSPAAAGLSGRSGSQRYAATVVVPMSAARTCPRPKGDSPAAAGSVPPFRTRGAGGKRVDGAAPERPRAAGEPHVGELFLGREQPLFLRGEGGELAVGGHPARPAGMRAAAGQRKPVGREQIGEERRALPGDLIPLAAEGGANPFHRLIPPRASAAAACGRASARAARFPPRAARPRAGRSDSGPTGRAGKRRSERPAPARARPTFC